MAKNKLRVALDNLKEALQQFSIKRALEGIRDRRSVSRGKKLVRELDKTYTNKEIAQGLEISSQKAAALRKKVREGEIASKTLNDLLEETQEKLPEIADRPREQEGTYTDEAGEKYKIDYVELSEEYLQKKLPWAQNVKTFASKRSALNYYGGATSGKEYFKIVRRKNGGWSMVDTRTARERNRSRAGKGVSGTTRADRIIGKDVLG